MSDWTRLPDLAGRALGGAVIAANDEFFAAKENLVKPEPAVARVEFGHKGKEYDGWETRRRRTPGHDWAIVRLGVPGVIAGVVVDTAFFTGNYPPQASLEGAAVEGHPSIDEVAKAHWEPLLPLSDLDGGTENAFAVESDRRVTHVRLNIHPDGGVARLRVHGTAVPDPRFLDAGPFDLAALENGGLVSGVSDEYFGRPQQLIAPGLTRSMGEGWETRRRRERGNDWVEVTLACEGVVTLAEPDTRHRFVLDGATGVERVRLDVFPDGGMARLRLWGRPTAAGREQLGRRWFDALPDVQAIEVLGAAGVPPADAGRVVGGRPDGQLPDAAARLVLGR